MGAAAKAVAGIEVEPSSPNKGLVQLIPPTLASAFPAGLTVAIPASARQGMRLIFVVQNHTASGTVAITGTAPLTGAALSETLPATGAIPTLEDPGEPVWFASVNGYASVTAGTGITVTGFTNGTITVFGVQVARRMLVGEVKVADKTGEVSPIEQRGSYDQDFHLLATKQDPSWEFSAAFYPDDGLFALLGAYNDSPSVATIPASPTVILTAAQTVTTSGNASATTQPVAPGEYIQVQLTGTAPATAATVSVTGVNIYGEHVTEVIVPSTKVQGTWTSQNCFKSIDANGIAWGAFGAGATMNVTGVQVFVFTGNPGDTLAAFTVEQYDSTSSMVAPFCLVDEWSLEGGMDKETKVAAKGPAQQVVPVGDPTNGTIQVASLAQVLDRPIMGWRGLVTIDPLTGSFGATQNADLLDWQVATKINWQQKYTSWGALPYRIWNRAYRKRRMVEVSLTLDMTNASYQAEYLAWKDRVTRLVQLRLLGRFCGVAAGTSYYLGFTFNGALKWVDEPARDFATGKESVEVKLKGTCKVQPSLGYSHQWTWYSGLPGW